MSILDYVYSPTSGYVGRKVKDYAPEQAGRQHDDEAKKRPIEEHQFKDSIGGDASNYEEVKA